jgi:hypothetical protein
LPSPAVEKNARSRPKQRRKQRKKNFVRDEYRTCKKS